MPSLSLLQDNFNAPTLGPQWGNSYGGAAAVAGQARVPCTSTYAGCQSGYAWSLVDSSFFVQVAVTPDGTSATEAYCAVTVQGTTEGTRVGFIINKVTGKLRCVSEVEYWDDTAVEIDYDPEAHAFLRLEESDGDLIWSTSPDGNTWTTRRTLTTPAWVVADADQCAVDMSAHRDGGTNDYAAFDLFNTLDDSSVVLGAGTGSAASSATATGIQIVHGAATGTATSTASASGIAIYHGTATGSAQSHAAVTAAGTDIPEVAALAAGTHNLVIEQGATFVQTYTVLDAGWTWDGWTARAQIRSAPADKGDLLLDLTPYLTVDGPAVRLAIPATVTETLTRNGVWDLEMSMGGTVVRILQGKVIVSLEVTR